MRKYFAVVTTWSG